MQKAGYYLKKLHIKEVMALLFILVALYFFRQQRQELASIGPALKNADGYWVAAGLVITGLYILLQSAMYVFSFASVGTRILWLMAIEVFLKRNFLSVFLPAGGVTALAYMPGRLRRSDVHKKEVHQASGIYAFAGILSIFLVGLPVIFYALLHSKNLHNAGWGIIILCLLIFVITIVLFSLRKKGWAHGVVLRFFPAAETKLNEMISFKLIYSQFFKVIASSVLVEFSGMAHLLIAMMAFGISPSLEAACVGYIVSIVLLASSPFLRGLGAVELSLTYILTLYNFSLADALGITILYRIFEFWLPLTAGLFSFAAKGKSIFLRLAPAVLIFVLGVVDILSAVTPPVRHRLFLLRQYIPTDIIQASNLLVILLGMLLIVTAAFLIRGLRNAWIIAMAVSILSLVLHLSKALDYEEATVAAFVILILLITRKQYRQKSNPALVSLGVVTSVTVFFAVVIFQVIGFYFLEKKHFGIDFSFQLSVKEAVRSFLLLRTDNFFPLTHFGTEFLVFIKVLSAATWVFFFYSIIRPYILNNKQNETEQDVANALLTLYGNNAVDYFKIASDKQLFFSETKDGFIAFRTANGFAIALDEPVCAEADKVNMIKAFDRFCKQNGLTAAYYRVDEDSLYYFDQLQKKRLLIGQEAVLNINQFTLEGKDRKSLRNALNSLSKKGYSSRVCKPPLSGSLLTQLAIVSAEWLAAFDKKEAVFSQGMFDAAVLCNQPVIVLEDAAGSIVAFLNIIPDYTLGGITYDMIRKTNDAPGGSMDALIIDLVNFGKAESAEWLNLGLVPLSGIAVPDSTAERVVKFAYEKIKRFQHYQGLREFKEKYATVWLNKYLLYENDFNLMQLPAALNKAMVPPKIKN